MADGGEGTVQAFIDSGARAEKRTVASPIGYPVEATLAVVDAAETYGSTAIIEVSAASGLSLVPPDQRDPKRTSSLGTGQLIDAALDLGVARIVVGIGGSATNDAGAGMLKALGAKFLDREGKDIVAPGGAALLDLRTIDLAGFDRRVRETRFDVAADVDNPLCGPNGASAIFGPQKGATPEDVVILDAALAHFADVAAQTLGADYRDEPGSGAAGGLGFALRAFCGATLRPGVEIVAELRGLPAALDDARAIFTGEGSIDQQTLSGKTVAGVARLARAAGVPTIVAFGGRVERSVAQTLHDKLGVIVLPIALPDIPLEQSMRSAAEFLAAASRNAVMLLRTTPDPTGGRLSGP